MNSSLKWTIYYEEEKWTSTVEYIRDDLQYLKKCFAWHPSWAPRLWPTGDFRIYNDDGGCDVIDRWMDASNGEWYVVIKIFQRYRDCPRQPDHWVSFTFFLVVYENEHLLLVFIHRTFFSSFCHVILLFRARTVDFCISLASIPFSFDDSINMEHIAATRSNTIRFR